METKQEKIDYIYKKIADKNLSFGCKVLITEYWKRKWKINIIKNSNKDNYWKDKTNISFIDKIENWSNCLSCIDNDDINREYFNTYHWYDNIKNKEKFTYFKIIWHPVMIWDICDYLEKNNLLEYIDWIIYDDVWDIQQFNSYILADYKLKRRPIEEQDTKCIDLIYNLIK